MEIIGFLDALCAYFTALRTAAGWLAFVGFDFAWTGASFCLNRPRFTILNLL